VGSHRGPGGTQGGLLHCSPCCDGVQYSGQGLVVLGSPAGVGGRDDTSAWGADISGRVISVEGVQLRQDPWVPGARLEQSAQGKVVQPGLCGWTSGPHQAGQCLASPLQLPLLGTGLAETSVANLTGVLPVKEKKSTSF